MNAEITRNDSRVSMTKIDNQNGPELLDTVECLFYFKGDDLINKKGFVEMLSGLLQFNNYRLRTKLFYLICNMLTGALKETRIYLFSVLKDIILPLFKEPNINKGALSRLIVMFG